MRLHGHVVIAAKGMERRQLTALLRGYEEKRRKIGLQIMKNKDAVRTSLGEIKRYRKPPGIIANVVVALLLSVGDLDVIAQVARMEAGTLRGHGSHKTTHSHEALDAWDKLWQVARRQVQLSYQHPNFILRRMQQVARDVTSPDTAWLATS